MREEILQIDEHRLLVAGLQWERTGDGIKAVLGRLGGKGYISIKEKKSKEILYGVSTNAPKKKEFSLAALVAKYLSSEMMVENALVWTSIKSPKDGDEVYSFIGVIGGQPAPGYDEVGGYFHTKALFDRYVDDTEGLDVTVFIEDKVPYQNDFGLDIAPISLVDIAEFLKKKGVERRVAIGGAPFNPIPLLLGTTAVALICGYFYMDYVEQEEAKLRAAQAAARMKTPDQAYRESLKAEYLKTGWSGQNFSAALSKLRTIKLSGAGWSAKKIECVANQGGCRIQWERERKTASFKSLSDFRSGSEISFDKGSVETIPMPKHGIAELPRNSLPAVSEIYTSFVSRLQRLEATGNLSVTVSNAGVFGKKQAKLKEPVYSVLANVSGKAYLLPAVEREIVAKNNIVVENLSFAVDGDQTKFALRARIFAK